jgi:chromate transporter
LTPPEATNAPSLAHRLRELAFLFLKLGAVAFGGPAAHISMMEDQIVSRRGWLSREEFLDFLGAANLIPGPTSTEMAIYIGRLRAGVPGLIVAGACFILPACLMVAALAWAYVRFGSLPQIAGVLYGVKPVVMAIIAQAVYKLARTALKSWALALLGAAAVIALARGMDELLVLALSGLAAGLFFAATSPKTNSLSLGLALSPASLPAAAAPFSFFALFAVFFKIGAILFGGGYVLVALLRSELVARLGWITERQLLDAVAVGQVTPGPISTSATFIGYLLGGFPGAMLATVAVFLPAFILVAISGPLVPRIRRSPLAGAILDGINAGALALIAVVTWQLFRSAVVDWITLALAAFSALLLFRTRINSLWLVLGGGLAGWITLAMHG